MTYKNILLIDDDEDDRELFLSAVSELSSDVACTAMSSAKDALEKLKSGEIAPELIFLDLNMPVMNGQQFLAAVKQEPGLSRLPVVIFSTSSNTDIVYQTRDLGSQGFITKPHSFKQMKEVIGDWIL